jgi:eukaryotic-like serine/threonine-protein kinase
VTASGGLLADLDTLDFAPAFAVDFDLDLPAELFLIPAPSPRLRSRPTRDFDQALRDLEPELPALGQTIDKYVLEKPIGIGGFAVVFRARHLLLDTTFALKLLRPSVLRQRPELATFLGEEARVAAKIHHPNVVRVVDVTMGSPYSYIVMEYIAGPDLSSMLRQKGLLPAKMVLRIVSHVAAALRAGLSQQLVHRDIKPSNILLTREGVTKLVDFGLARSYEINVDRGAVVGTLGYMSPEHIESPHTVDHRSDIFSLGVTAYRAITGLLPVQANNSAQAIAMLRTQAITAPHRLNTKVTTEVSDLIMWMLQLEPSRRPRDYDVLINAAEKAATATRPRKNSKPVPM